MAGKDYPEYLQPDQTQNLQVQGDYIYCKFAERPIRIIDNGKPVEMIAGDKYRPGHRFDSVYVHNPDKENPISAVLTIGTGDFDRQIVQGEIKAEPILRAADGTTRPDTRFDIAVNLEPVKLATTAWQKGQVVGRTESFIQQKPFGKQWKYFRRNGITTGPDGLLYVQGTTENYKGYMLGFDPNSMEPTRMTACHLGHGPGLEGYQITNISYSKQYGFLGLTDNGVLVTNKTENREDQKAIVTLKNDSLGSGQWLKMANDTKRDYLLVKGDQYLGLYNDKFDLIKERTGFYSGNYINYDPVKDKYLVDKGSEGFQYLDPVTLETVEQWKIENKIWTAEGIQTHGKLLFQWGGRESSEETWDVLEKIAREDFETKPQFDPVNPGCELVQSLAMTREGNQTTAEIQTESMGQGIKVTGEIIKAAIEYHFGLPVADDYLDHVYSLNLGSNAAGRNQKPIVTGSQTFARAEIQDQGEIYLPDTVTLTVDNGLDFKSPLHF